MYFQCVLHVHIIFSLLFLHFNIEICVSLHVLKHLYMNIQMSSFTYLYLNILFFDGIISLSLVSVLLLNTKGALKLQGLNCGICTAFIRFSFD